MNPTALRSLFLTLFTASLFSSCASTSSSLPTNADLERNRERYRILAQPRYDELERDRSSGKISQAAYEAEKALLDRRVDQKAIDAAWTAHELAESERRGLGIPTANSPQQTPVGQTGGGVLGGNSFYQPRNDPYSSGQSSTPGGGSGYTPGSSIMGSRGRTF